MLAGQRRALTLRPGLIGDLRTRSGELQPNSAALKRELVVPPNLSLLLDPELL